MAPVVLLFLNPPSLCLVKMSLTCRSASPAAEQKPNLTGGVGRLQWTPPDSILCIVCFISFAKTINDAAPQLPPDQVLRSNWKEKSEKLKTFQSLNSERFLRLPSWTQFRVGGIGPAHLVSNMRSGACPLFDVTLLGRGGKIQKSKEVKFLARLSTFWPRLMAVKMTKWISIKGGKSEVFNSVSRQQQLCQGSLIALNNN